ncbi:EF-hand domain-containing protein [Nonomuraea sp. NBC_01738]|uniref:EF-hand domain-containing protein n=1 Tax=Nonomuraea sp. NBC_01738 TaxID=2976003 RepID=UPI002E0D48AB|nr:EF-hand domain-containing protein [Nonomuraea sp. NBC_01738]
MASTFQRSKIELVFRAMDTDGDGRLRESDFAALARRWASVRAARPTTADHTTADHTAGDHEAADRAAVGDEERLSGIMHGWWGTLAGRARDPESVTVDDVLTVVDLLGQMPGAVTATAEAMFEAVDEDGDGRISPAEYRRMIEAWNGRPTDTTAAFTRLDLDADGTISRAEFTGHWTEFWAGDDPAAPGSHVFGEPAASG